MPTSKDPVKRARQLANLKRGESAGNAGGRPVEHGGFARVSVDRLAAQEREVLEALADSAPVKAADGSVPAADHVVIVLFAETLCRRQTVKAALDVWPWRDRGNFANALAVEARLTNQCLRFAEQLAMTPAARHRLGLSVVPEEPPAPPDPNDAAEREAALARLRELDAGDEA